jgi:hypothetical protein
MICPNPSKIAIGVPREKHPKFSKIFELSSSKTKNAIFQPSSKKKVFKDGQDRIG